MTNGVRAISRVRSHGKLRLTYLRREGGVTTKSLLVRSTVAAIASLEAEPDALAPHREGEELSLGQPGDGPIGTTRKPVVQRLIGGSGELQHRLLGGAHPAAEGVADTIMFPDSWRDHDGVSSTTQQAGCDDEVFPSTQIVYRERGKKTSSDEFATPIMGDTNGFPDRVQATPWWRSRSPEGRPRPRSFFSWHRSTAEWCARLTQPIRRVSSRRLVDHVVVSSGDRRRTSCFSRSGTSKWSSALAISAPSSVRPS
jgi:hypothetical protein